MCGEGVSCVVRVHGLHVGLRAHCGKCVLYVR